MSNLNNIPIKNVFYMLSYAYRSLKIEDTSSFKAESFKNVTDLYTEILIISVSKIVKRGMWKEYRDVQEDSSFVKGKVELKETFSMKNVMKHKIAVRYEILSEDNLFNQIIKSILVKLLTHREIDGNKQKRLRNILIYFSDVEEVPLSLELWKNLNYTNHNIFYQLPMDICRYLYESLLLQEDEHSVNNQMIEDEQQLSRLFEKFVFNFYKKETAYRVSSPFIYWDVDDFHNDGLPIMKTDIVLKEGNDTLIIDTKFYQENMRKSYEGGKMKHIPSNIYQLFSYVENYKSNEEENVGGLLLYAKTNASEQPNHSYVIKGKKIGIETIDLSKDFQAITSQLLYLAEKQLSKE